MMIIAERIDAPTDTHEASPIEIEVQRLVTSRTMKTSVSIGRLAHRVATNPVVEILLDVAKYTAVGHKGVLLALFVLGIAIKIVKTWSKAGRK